MRWIDAVKKLSSDLAEPFELEFVWREWQDLSKLEWLNLQGEEISDADLSALTRFAARLKRHEPPQYILGWAEFCGLRFNVDARVLIPRPETEELVWQILSENPNLPLKVLDVGTGSGAIAVSLAKNRPSWQVTASDISVDALVVARENALANSAAVQFVQSDVLSELTDTYDLIVSNPPYVARADAEEMDESVKKYEPEQALFAESNGFAIYEKLAQQAKTHLSVDGKIYLEMGYKQGAALKALFSAAFPEKRVTVHQDSFGRERMLVVC
jgi:release factor glutamine methyltransferase